ncbi:MAG: methyl-accepting chemotaxis protein [Lachnospiraceae bacterium]|nr:methyl-accepting chemotaxis protein [Lachnospiraceae bacterium]
MGKKEKQEKPKKAKVKAPKAKSVKSIYSFQSKVTLLVILCVAVAVSITVGTLLGNTQEMVVNSSVGQMLNIATSYGNIVDSAEKGELLENDQYAELLSDLKIDSMESSYCFLLNKSGIITYHSDASQIGKPNRIPFITELIGQINRGVVPETLTASYEDEDTGKEIYCSYYLTACKSVLVVCADADELMSPLKDFIMQSVFILIAMLVLAIVISNIVVIRITKPIKQVTHIINDVSDLNFTLPANIQKLCKRKDESGQISRAVNDMCINLSDAVRKIEQASDNIDTNMGQLESSSNQVHIYCTDNSATTEQLAASMQETSAMAETINNHMIRMQEQSQMINKEASDGNDLSEEVAGRAKDLQTTTRNAITHTKNMYENVKDKTETAISRLEAVSKINELTEAIKEISDQTSLLSLNASIEAARAGEAGRGFAVVASEISNLAHRSLSSVNDINIIIEEVNSAVSNMSETMEETLSFLENNVLSDYDNFNQIGDQYLSDADVFKSSMMNISGEINELNTSIQQIATGISDIQSTVAEASIGVTNIAEKTSDTVTKASDNYQLAGDTKDSVTILKQIVDKFTL